MSHDQKPQKVRAVGNIPNGAGQTPGENEMLNAAATAVDGEGGAAASGGAGGISLITMLLFLVGCGLGGAAVAAVPYYLGGH